MTNILVILGHPSKDSFCNALLEAYIKGARKAGAEIRTLFLGELKFDPILHEGYNKVQELEPDLKKAQADILWAEHIVFVYPTWWGAMPAILKGFIDRIILPGFAFKFTGKYKWKKLLFGKTARIITTMNNNPLIYRIIFRSSGVRVMKQSILEFCGIRTKVMMVGPVKDAPEKKKKQWIKKAYNIGKCMR